MLKCARVRTRRATGTDEHPGPDLRGEPRREARAPGDPRGPAAGTLGAGRQENPARQVVTHFWDDKLKDKASEFNTFFQVSYCSPFRHLIQRNAETPPEQYSNT